MMTIRLMAAILVLTGIVTPLFGAEKQKNRPKKGVPDIEVVLAGPQYPGSVEISQSGYNHVSFDKGEFFTADTIEKVKAFYEQKTGMSLAVENGSAKVCRDVTFTDAIGQKNTRNGCVVIRSKVEHEWEFRMLEEGMAGPPPGMSSPTDRDYRAACRKYKDLADRYFPSGKGTHKQVVQELYAKYVEPVEKRVEEEAQQQEQQDRAKANSPEAASRKEEQKKIQEQIKQLKKEGRNNEAMALAMQMMQDQNGIMARSFAEGAANQEKKLDQQRAGADEKKKAYIRFLEELAQETSYKTQIIIDHLEGDTGG